MKNKELELKLKMKSLDLIKAIIDLENVLETFDSDDDKPYAMQCLNVDGYLRTIKARCFDLVKN